ncbi:hypothetical protein [Sphingorhabdus sp. SMR4y]|uniref:Gldg family protein n=1 Tax=Sphingorhabdus sp. SMR4y TaxID=2584094 RepID=UPI000B5C33B3|nr:hypothetical protein [Sphingorhabdus sp. SMR4y]ASK86873.1 ABC-type uncharacterized transport system [Sphingorhabdus sp. SMR4y]
MTRFWQTVPSALLAFLFLAQCSAGEPPPDPQQPRARIQLMTSLPLVWGDGASMESILSGDSEPAPIYRYWQQQYEMTAVDSLENLAAEDPDIVILAQPRAMDPADLTDLDGWVRAGGAVIILTDPELVWPSRLPLGDPRRPLASGLLSPLLDHWGLELVAADADSTELEHLRFGDHVFASRRVGKIEPVKAGKASDADCEWSDVAFVVQCSVGQGRAAIVADADFLHATLWPEAARKSPQTSGAVRFVDSLVRHSRETDDRRK